MTVFEEKFRFLMEYWLLEQKNSFCPRPETLITSRVHSFIERQNQFLTPLSNKTTQKTSEFRHFRN